MFCLYDLPHTEGHDTKHEFAPLGVLGAHAMVFSLSERLTFCRKRKKINNSPLNTVLFFYTQPIISGIYWRVQV